MIQLCNLAFMVYTSLAVADLERYDPIDISFDGPDDPTAAINGMFQHVNSGNASTFLLATLGNEACPAPDVQDSIRFRLLYDSERHRVRSVGHFRLVNIVSWSQIPVFQRAQDSHLVHLELDC